MNRIATVAAVATGLFAGAALVASPLEAQNSGQNSGEDPHVVTWTVEAFGGGADFGSFLGQRVSTVTEVRERELEPATSGMLGAAVSAQVWPQAAIRLGGSWHVSEFEFKDDTGDEGETLRNENLSDLDIFTGDLEVLLSLFERESRFQPYGMFGIAGVAWSPDEEAGGGLLSEDDPDTQFTIAAKGGGGMLFALTPSIGIRVELANYAANNPFDGEDAFRLGPGEDQGEKFDEPETVRITRITAGLTYTFGGGR